LAAPDLVNDEGRPFRKLAKDVSTLERTLHGGFRHAARELGVTAMHQGFVRQRECGDFGTRLMALNKGDGLWLD